MGKKPFKVYKGPLTPVQAAEGMNAARRNAMRLLGDARFLFDGSRQHSALALAILSIEESGKLPWIRRIVLATEEGELKELWRGYRDHQSKNNAWIVPDLAVKGARKLDDLRIIFDKSSDHPELLDGVKQLATYTECFEGSKWSEPNDFGTKEMVERILFAAATLVPKRDTTVREMELWVESMRRYSNATSREGLIDFFKAMIAEGMTKFGVEDIQFFLDEGTNPAS
jgi:AbiV family abortive infection protein